MSLARRHAVLALLASGHDVHLTGVGWDDYREAESLRKNLDRISPRVDAVYWYKPLGSRECRALRESAAHGCLAVESYNEAWWPGWRARDESALAGTNLIICHHLADVPQFNGGGMRVEHIPHAASELFAHHARPWVQRDIPLIVTGTLAPDFYPLRCRLADLVRRGRLPGLIIPHPGYRLGSLAEVEFQERRYADLLGRSKLSVVCSSIYGYGLSKYVESARAGAIPFGDLPQDFSHTLSAMPTVSLEDSDDAIVAKAELALSVGHDLSDRLRTAAEQHHDMADYARRTIELMRA